VTASTFTYSFGAKFEMHYLDSTQAGARAQHRIFALMRAGHDALHALALAGDANFVTARAHELADKAHRAGGINVGVHVRRGDRRPWAFMYREDYIPLLAYMDAARALLAARFARDDPAHAPLPPDEDGVLQLAAAPLDADPSAPMVFVRRAAAPGLLASAVVLASDDPEVYGRAEVRRATRAQDRIVLASKAALEGAAVPPPPRKNAWVDDVHGWERGFFASTFWGLGLPESNIVNNVADLEEERAARARVLETGLPEAARAVREAVGRGYLLDLGVLGSTDAVVCAVSSASCRVLAVMLGWERAIEKGEWVNIDGNYGWVGLVVDEDA